MKTYTLYLLNKFNFKYYLYILNNIYISFINTIKINNIKYSNFIYLQFKNNSFLSNIRLVI